MKVLMVTPYYYPIIGGTESLVENIAIKLNEHNVHTDVMTFNYNMQMKPVWSEETETINGVNVTRVPVIRLPRPTFFVNHLPGYFRTKLKQYDLIHFHNDTDLSFPLFSHNLNKKTLFHCHCLDTTFYDYRRNPIARNILIRSADIFITLSDFLFKLLNELGVAQERIRILPNGVDTNKFKEGTNEKIPNLLLFVGRLDPKKGIPVLLASLKNLKKPVRLVIIGPPSTYTQYSANVMKLIGTLSKKTNHEITYLGKVPINELIGWYQKASMVILPSIYESFPMVTMESLACGTPVVASNVGAIPEVVRDYENGLLVPPNNPTKLAEAIQYLLDNGSVRKEFGRKGREWIVKNFSSDIVIERLIQIYHSLL